MNSRREINTGAASGIGATTMAKFTRRGNRDLALDRNAVGTDLVRCDARDQDSVDAADGEAATRPVGLEVLVNCAELAPPQSAGLPPDERAEAVIDINLLGPWRVTSAALPALRESHGRVVNVASGMAFVALPFAPAYAMSKHGVVAYSQALRLEHGDAISVTTVYPGYINTPIQKDSVEFGLGLAGTSPEETLEDAVAAFVRAALLVLSNDSQVSDELLALAAERGAAVVVSPLDTYVTGRMITLAAPCRALMQCDPLTITPEYLAAHVSDQIKQSLYGAAIVPHAPPPPRRSPRRWNGEVVQDQDDTHLVHDRAARDVDVCGGHGAGLVRGHEGCHVAHVGQCRGPVQQGGLLDAGDDVLASWNGVGEGLGHPARFQGHDADAVAAELAGPLSAKPLDGVEGDLETSQPREGMGARSTERQDHP